MKYFSILLSIIVLFSCKKQEGVGGKSSITGKVYAIDMNNDFTKVQSEYYSAKEDVYIVYGDDLFYSDKVETHYDGSFLFEHLNPGNYTVYVYSKDSSEQQDIIPVISTVTLSKKDELIVLDDFEIIKQ